MQTSLVGRVGGDEMGMLLMEHLWGLQLPHLNTASIRMERAASTGVAVQVSTALDGRRTHVVCQGANGGVSAPEVSAALGR